MSVLGSLIAIRDASPVLVDDYDAIEGCLIDQTFRSFDIKHGQPRNCFGARQPKGSFSVAIIVKR